MSAGARRPIPDASLSFLQKIAYRVAPFPTDQDLHPRNRRRARTRWSPWALVLVTIGADGQGPLLFGVALLTFEGEVRRTILFYRDGIPAKDVQALKRYARAEGLGRPIPLEGFLEVLFTYAYRKRIPVVLAEAEATLGRLASDWSATKPGSFYEGGVSLIPFTKPERRNPDRPRRRKQVPKPKGKPRKQPRLRSGWFEDGDRVRIVSKRLESGELAVSFTGRGEPDEKDRIPEGEGRRRRGFVFRGHFVLLERWARGLGEGRTESLRAMCEAFGLPWMPIGATGSGPITSPRIARAVYEAEAEHRLYLELLRRHGRLAPLGIQPDEVFGQTSYAKAAFGSVGVDRPLTKWGSSLDGLGIGACGSYGAWSGVGWRATRAAPFVRATRLDFVREYAVVAHRYGIWDLLCSRRIEMVGEDPSEIEGWIGDRTWEQMLHPQTSNEPRVFIRMRPDGDFLPHRIRPRDAWVTNVGPLTYDGALWWPLSDGLISFFETGRVPRIEAAMRLVGHGRQRGLRSMELPEIGMFDPNVPGADLFLFIAEGAIAIERRTDLDPAERDRWATLYKGWDNSACSGIFLETHQGEPWKRPRKVRVIGPDGPYETSSLVEETVGDWFCPPIYALVTGGGRLLLYLGMRAAREAGHEVGSWDTDGFSVLEELPRLWSAS